MLAHKGFLAVITLGFVILLACYGMLRFAYTPLSPHMGEHTIKVERGMSVRQIINALEEAALINQWQAKQLIIWVKLKRVERNIKAGTYIFSGSMTADHLLNKLVKGEVVQYALTIIEGHTAQDFMKQLQQHPGVVQTVATLSEEALLEQLEVADIYPALEGIFFPDTYYFPAGTKDITLLKIACQTMRTQLDSVWEGRDKNIAIQSKYDALILASIIEKESQLDEERAQISGVFHRRLQKKMRLQADPTVVYGLADKSKPLSKEDLKNTHLFNTYVHHRLPPTPIALPSFDSLKAAVNPDQGQALYFVAKGDGSHVFSDTLAAHNEAVARYQRKPVVQGDSRE